MEIWFEIACDDAEKCEKLGLPESGILASDNAPQRAVCDELARYGVACQPAATNAVEVWGIVRGQKLVWLCGEM